MSESIDNELARVEQELGAETADQARAIIMDVIEGLRRRAQGVKNLEVAASEADDLPAQLVRRMVQWIDDQGLTNKKGGPYLLIWYAQKAKRELKIDITNYVRPHLLKMDDGETQVRLLRKVIAEGMQREKRNASLAATLRSCGCDLAKRFAKSLSSEEKKKFEPWLKKLLGVVGLTLIGEQVADAATGAVAKSTALKVTTAKFGLLIAALLMAGGVALLTRIRCGATDTDWGPPRARSNEAAQRSDGGVQVSTSPRLIGTGSSTTFAVDEAGEATHEHAGDHVPNLQSDACDLEVIGRELAERGATNCGGLQFELGHSDPKSTDALVKAHECVMRAFEARASFMVFGDITAPNVVLRHAYVGYEEGGKFKIDRFRLELGSSAFSAFAVFRARCDAFGSDPVVETMRGAGSGSDSSACVMNNLCFRCESVGKEELVCGRGKTVTPILKSWSSEGQSKKTLGASVARSPEPAATSGSASSPGGARSPQDEGALCGFSRESTGKVSERPDRARAVIDEGCRTACGNRFARACRSLPDPRLGPISVASGVFDQIAKHGAGGAEYWIESDNNCSGWTSEAEDQRSMVVLLQARNGKVSLDSAARECDKRRAFACCLPPR